MKQEIKKWSDRTGFASNFENLNFGDDKYWTHCKVTAKASKGGGGFDVWVRIGNQEHKTYFNLEEGQSKSLDYTADGFCSISVNGALNSISLFQGAGGTVTVTCDYDETAIPVDRKRWMAGVSDDTPLARLTIPGTHDTCALIKGRMVECQTWTIPEQLRNGIRFLDIRCRHYENIFTIHHGMYYQNIAFGTVLDQCKAFLNENPTECILMSVKEEYDPADCTRKFHETFDDYVTKKPGIWYLDDAIPNMGSARGKVVVFRRFSAPGDKARGLDVSVWKDDASFETRNKTAAVQDMYKSIGNDKWDAIQPLLKRAKTENSDVMFLNFSSATSFPFHSPADVAADMNGRLTDYLTGNGKCRYGTVIMDFPDKDLIGQLIMTNPNF